MNTLKVDPEQIEKVRKQYENTPLWLKAPNGMPTKLTEQQWLMVRTLDFKLQYGDWLGLNNKLALEFLDSIEAMDVAKVPEYFKEKKSYEHRKEKVDWAYNQIKDKSPISPIGNIKIFKSGINDSIFEGSNIYKASLYPILDELIKNSVLLHSNIDINGKRQFVLGSKFFRNGRTGYVGIVIKEDSKGNKYYSHTIYKNFSREAKSETGNQSQTPTLHPAVYNILQEILAVNPKSISIPLDPDTGEPAL